MPDWQNLMILGGFVLAGVGFVILKRRVGKSSGVIALLAIIMAIGVGFVGAGVTGNILAEDNDLMSRLGWKPTGFIVTSVTTDDVCAVLEGDDDVTCMSRELVFNDGEEAYGFSAIQLHPGSYFSATRLKILGEDGILLQVPM